jgi:glycosyltransferase involved in cell wall biosynthesis
MPRQSAAAAFRSLLGRGVRAAGRLAAAPLVDRWPPYSRLLLVSDEPQWVIGREMRTLAATARRLGIKVADGWLVDYTRHQSVFYGSHFNLLSGRRIDFRHRIATAYFHGRPGSGVPAFDAAFQRLRELHARIDRVQVSHREMRELVIEAGVAADRVFLIPLGVDLHLFPMRTRASRATARTALGIPESAAVVGSFQKDGVGWSEGLQPKLEKGPDVLIEALARVKAQVPELFVLLTGPARGFVKTGLERAGIPYRHVFVEDDRRIADCYHAIDVYLVTSRQEGGPKAVLESMACGVPLVTTRVGQAMDLVRHGDNAWMVGAEDVEGLAFWVHYAITNLTSIGGVIEAGRATAEANSDEALLPLWRRFMTGFVAFG